MSKFQANVSCLGDSINEMSNPVFWGTLEKYLKMLSAEFAHSMLRAMDTLSGEAALLTLVLLNKLRCHTHSLLIFSQSEHLIQIVDINSHI